MQNAGRNEPARAELEPVCRGQTENSVVALLPVFEALPDVCLGRARNETHKRIRKVIVDVVELRRKVITFGLRFLVDERGILRTLMHVEWDGAHVVEKLGEHRPAPIFLVNRRTDQPRPHFCDGVFERESLLLKEDEAQTFVPDAAVVGGFNRASQPALVDSTAVGAVGIEMIRMKTKPAAWMEETARHPGRSESQNSVAGFERSLEAGPDAARRESPTDLRTWCCRCSSH